MEIDGVQVGRDSPPFFIAEAGVNHNGELEKAKKLIEVAAESGADAVKFQTFTTERLVTPDANKADYQTEKTGEGSQYEMLKQYELDRSAHKQLMAHCEKKDVTFLSSPFDPDSADMLADLGVSAIKIGSGELDNHPFLKHVAELGLPLIVSTGMGTMDEVQAAREVIRSVDPNIELSFLHCTSSYPCSIEDVNLRAMEAMMEVLEEPVGYSDHTTIPETPSFAVSCGAPIVEKHFTLDSTSPGPDQEASLEPSELERAVALVRSAFKARGNRVKKPTESELETRDVARKSLHAATDLSGGTILTRSHIDIIRPADGLSPASLESVLGTEINQELTQGDPIVEAVLNSHK